MKAVAGQEISSKREILEDEPEDNIAPHFLPIIQRMCEHMNPDLAELAKGTECFGHLWEDSEGICPEAQDCLVATYCKAVFMEAAKTESSTQEHYAPPEVDDEEEEPEEEIEVPSIAQPGALKPVEKNRRKKKPKTKPIQRGVYKDTPKYERHGYFDMGRPVDQSIRRFVHELNYPFELPKTWSRRTMLDNWGDQGKVLLAKTASYHTIFVDGNAAVRVWTSAAGYAIVDLSHILVAKYRSLGMPVAQIPPKSRNTKKFAEFGGRTHIKNEEDAVRIANILKETYKIPKRKRSKKKTKNA